MWPKTIDRDRSRHACHFWKEKLITVCTHIDTENDGQPREVQHAKGPNYKETEGQPYGTGCGTLYHRKIEKC